MGTPIEAAPHLAPGVVVHRPITDAGAWIVERPGTNPLRVGADAGRLLSALDGVRGSDELATQLGTKWTDELVRGALAKFGELGLLGTDRNAVAPRERRVVLLPPAAVQLRLIRATRVLDPLRGLLSRLSGRAVVTTAAVLGAAGLLALALQPDVVVSAVAAPMTLPAFGWIWIGLVATTVVHELCHGATLTHHGGRPGWLGVMLFYLTPACFCEVTDGWRLPRPRQRVAIALAGVSAQAVIGGVAAAIALPLPPGDTRTTVVGFALACYFIGVLNLVPFIKLDGYLALMAAVDVPHLRDKAIRDARGWWSRRLFGVAAERQLPHLRWAVPYGMLCAAFPVVILTAALTRWTNVMLAAGFAGAIVVCLLAVYLAYRLLATVFGVLADARRGGASWFRLAAVVVTGAAALVAVATLVHVPYRIPAGYVADAAGIRLVLPSGTDVTELRPGQRVVLERGGLFFTTTLGTAEIGAGTATPAEVPVSALLPLRSDIPGHALTLPLSTVDAGGLPERSGLAHVETGSVSLGTWAGRRYLRPVLAPLFG
ncbi:daptide biosynthesis intramembrane metalloprotease [Amycolatopsis sp. NPDC059027]|uniref:daptide biosynthesis intramembrane metalloprotease n=1 Tax=Amycolatopsis sp. NPDC059027 TaxID=3346709 RepID=UPI00366B4637